jgi:V/A-type H+-transporting ATPase subunit B
MFREYRTICDLSDSMLTVTNVKGVALYELGEVFLPNGTVCPCQVIEVDAQTVRAILLASPKGICMKDAKVRFLGYGIELPLSEDLLGRIWNSLGEPIDGGPAVLPEKYIKIKGQPINPLARIDTEKKLETNLDFVDGGNSLHLGEVRIIDPCPATPAMVAVAQIAEKAKIAGQEDAFTIVISATGSSFEERERLTDELRRLGLTARTVLFTSELTDPPILRLATAHTAMTAAEYFAFDKGRHVLFIQANILDCMDAYADSMQRISDLDWEVPSIGAHPYSYLYADIAVLKERIGCRQGREGSITLLSIMAEG